MVFMFVFFFGIFVVIVFDFDFTFTIIRHFFSLFIPLWKDLSGGGRLYNMVKYQIYRLMLIEALAGRGGQIWILLRINP